MEMHMQIFSARWRCQKYRVLCAQNCRCRGPASGSNWAVCWVIQRRRNTMDLNDKVLLVTGGTGSFGRKLTEIILKEWRPRKLIIFSRDELKQSEMRQQLQDPCLRYFIGDVRDRDRLERAMNGVDIVIHAAALKQVPACEYNPFEAVKTNVVGAQNVIEAAIGCGVK